VVDAVTTSADREVCGGGSGGKPPRSKYAGRPLLLEAHLRSTAGAGPLTSPCPWKIARANNGSWGQRQRRSVGVGSALVTGRGQICSRTVAEEIATCRRVTALVLR